MFIVTNSVQAELMKKETKGRMQDDHVLIEPAARNTAACIGYAAMEIVKNTGTALCVFSLPTILSKTKRNFPPLLMRRL